MPIDFPGTPINGQIFTDGDKTWVYSTTIGAWNLQTQVITGATGPTGPQGATGPQGPQGAAGSGGGSSTGGNLYLWTIYT